MSPQKRHVEILNPSNSECDLIWKQTLYNRDDQVKIKSLEWVQIQLNYYPYKRGEIWTHAERRQHEDKGENTV